MSHVVLALFNPDDYETKAILREIDNRNDIDDGWVVLKQMFISPAEFLLVEYLWTLDSEELGIMSFFANKSARESTTVDSIRVTHNQKVIIDFVFEYKYGEPK